MAINPDNITTIRVDQLPEDTLALVNEFAHANGTELKKATIQSLVDLVAAAVGAGSGVGFLPISVTDGQQLPDVPADPSFFLAGIGTYLNINGFPDLICTEELNAIMSLSDHWEIAVEIPINAEIGVQSVTGSAVDNTDPLNPIINSTGGGGSQTLQEVSDTGGLSNGATLKQGTTDAGLGGVKGIALKCSVDYELKWEAGRLYVMEQDGFTIREVSHNFTVVPAVTDDTTKGFVVGSRWLLDDGTLYTCSDNTTGAAVWDITVSGTPTLDEVLAVGNTANLKDVILVTDGLDDLGNFIAELEGSVAQTKVSYQQVIITDPDSGNTALGWGSLTKEDVLGNVTRLQFENATAAGGIINIPDVAGSTETLALLSDIPTKTSDLINDGDDGNPFISLLDLPSNIIFYPTTVASDISGYVKIVTSITDPSYNTTAVDVSTGAITTTNQLISSLATAPNIIVGNPGVFNITTIGNIRRISGSGTASFYFQVYKRTSGGVETLIATSDNTIPVLDSGTYIEFSATAIWDDGIFSATDRVVMKYYANRIAGGSNPTYQFQFGGVTPVRTLVPIPLSVVPILTIDATPTDGSTNAVSSNGVFDALALKADKTDVTDCVVLASSISTTSLTAVDTNLKHAIAANQELFFECMLSTTTASGGVKYQITVPTGAVVTGLFMTVTSTTTTFRSTQLIANSLTVAVQTTASTVGSVLQFSVKNSTTAGDVIVSFASGTGGTTTIEAGSSLVKNKTRAV